MDLDLGEAVARLGDLEARPSALAVIDAAGGSAVPALRAGLRHGHWRVRHMSARLLDDLPLDAETLELLLEVARTDSHRKVRAQAYHAAGCDACKPAGSGACEFDKVGMLVAALADGSLRVRRRATTGLLFEAVLNTSDDLRVRAAIRAAASDPDPTIARRARLASRYLTGAS